MIAPFVVEAQRGSRWETVGRYASRYEAASMFNQMIESPRCVVWRGDVILDSDDLGYAATWAARARQRQETATNG